MNWNQKRKLIKAISIWLKICEDGEIKTEYDQDQFFVKINKINK